MVFTNITIPRSKYPQVGSQFYIYNQYTLRVKDGDKLQAHLKANGIGSEVYYPVPLDVQECFKGLGYRAGDMPRSEEAAAQAISIPIYSELTDATKGYVVEAVKEFYS